MTTEERLEKVERELARAKRRSRWLLAVIILAAGTWIAIAGCEETTTDVAAQTEGQGSKIVRANAFILEDRNGRTRAGLEMGKGGPGMTVYDKEGKGCSWLDTMKDRPVLTMYDWKGTPRAGLGVGRYGPMLALANEKGIVHAWLGTGW